MKKALLAAFLLISICFISCADSGAQENKEVSFISTSKSHLTLFEGQSYTVEAEAFPPSAEDTQIIWASANSDICKVNGGVITAVREGTCVVKASCKNGVSSMITVIVLNSDSVRSLHLSENTLPLTVGQSRSLVAYSNPESDVGRPPVIWKSSNEAVAVVDSNGLVTAKAPGSCIIEATLADRIRTVCAVSVVRGQFDLHEYDLTELVSLEVRDLPLTLENINEVTGEVITRFEATSYEVLREMYDEDGVKVTLNINCKKTYDRGGAEAKNSAGCYLNLYMEEDKPGASFYREASDDTAVKVGESFQLTLEFESIINIEQRQFYVTLNNHKEIN